MNAIHVRNVLRSLILLATPAGIAAGAEVTLPHTFTSGTPARAAEVNANFTVLKDAVNANAQAIEDLGAQVPPPAASGGLALRVNGTTVGTYVKLSSFDEPILALSNLGYFLWVSTGAEGLQSAEGNLEPPERLHYDQPGCTGNTYITTEEEEDIVGAAFILRQGVVVGSANENDPVKAYVIKGTPSPTWLYSTGSPWTDCEDYSPAISLPALQPVPNDPSTTGVPNDLSGLVEIVVR